MRSSLVDGFRSQGLRDRMGSRLKLRCSRFATRQWGQQHPTSADRNPHICYMYLPKLLHVRVFFIYLSKLLHIFLRLANRANNILRPSTKIVRFVTCICHRCYMYSSKLLPLFVKVASNIFAARQRGQYPTSVGPDPHRRSNAVLCSTCQFKSCF